MWSFEVCYVVVGQTVYEWEGHKYGDFSNIRPPPMGLSFELQQHIIPQKITFFMTIYDYENQNIV